MALVRPFGDKRPRLAPTAFLADNATVIGDVDIGAQASVWYGAVLRGDVGWIRIGARSNVQDLSCIHMTTDASNTFIGEDVTIGHGVMIHGATVLDGALIGLGSILMDNCEIGEEALIAAGTLIPPRMVVPPRVLVRGRPGRVVRALTEEEQLEGRRGAVRYLALAELHLHLQRARCD
jgi:carbonic anhydrase/acetyltransferase-like protein (isoleucine patch superfamily)